MSNLISFEVNGEIKHMPQLPITQLLTELKITDTAGLALAINNQVIPKLNWPKVIINAGDKILLVSATQGG